MTKQRIRVVTATEAKNRFGDIIRGAYLRAEHLIVKRDGVPVVAIVPISDYERLVNRADLPLELADEVAASVRNVRARARLTDFLNEVQEDLPQVSEEAAARDIEEAVRAVRADGKDHTASQ